MIWFQIHSYGHTAVLIPSGRPTRSTSCSPHRDGVRGRLEGGRGGCGEGRREGEEKEGGGGGE